VVSTKYLLGILGKYTHGYHGKYPGIVGENEWRHFRSRSGGKIPLSKVPRKYTRTFLLVLYV
jgi:hypothetical protein